MNVRAQKLAETKARKVRAEAVSHAIADEMERFNAAIAAGATVMLKCHCGTYRVSRVRHDFFYHTPGANAGFGFSWAGCNDGTWADLLRQAGVTRNPLFLVQS